MRSKSTQPVNIQSGVHNLVQGDPREWDIETAQDEIVIGLYDLRVRKPKFSNIPVFYRSIRDSPKAWVHEWSGSIIIPVDVWMRRTNK